MKYIIFTGGGDWGCGLYNLKNVDISAYVNKTLPGKLSYDCLVIGLHAGVFSDCPDSMPTELRVALLPFLPSHMNEEKCGFGHLYSPILNGTEMYELLLNIKKVFLSDIKDGHRWLYSLEVAINFIRKQCSIGEEKTNLPSQSSIDSKVENSSDHTPTAIQRLCDEQKPDKKTRSLFDDDNIGEPAITQRLYNPIRSLKDAHSLFDDDYYDHGHAAPSIFDDNPVNKPAITQRLHNPIKSRKDSPSLFDDNPVDKPTATQQLNSEQKKDKGIMRSLFDGIQQLYNYAVAPSQSVHSSSNSTPIFKFNASTNHYHAQAPNQQLNSEQKKDNLIMHSLFDSMDNEQKINKEKLPLVNDNHVNANIQIEKCALNEKNNHQLDILASLHLDHGTDVHLENLKNLNSDDITFIFSILAERPIVNLNLNEINLNFEHVLQLAGLIKINTSLRTLNLSNARIEAGAASVLVQAINQSRSLTTINITNTLGLNCVLYTQLNIALTQKHIQVIGALPLPMLNNPLPAAHINNASYNIPDEYICKITHQIMLDPVIAADKETYEREAIIEWLATSNNSPSTDLKLDNKNVLPNLTFKRAINAYLNDHPELWDSGEVYYSKKLEDQYLQAMHNSNITEQMRLEAIDPRLRKLDPARGAKIAASQLDQLDEAKANSNLQIPQKFRCLITNKIMFNPVMASNGDNYEKETIENLFAHPDINHPLPQEILVNKILIPNKLLKKEIAEFINKHPALCDGFAIYESDALKTELCKAIEDKNPAKIDEILTNDMRLLTKILSPEKSILTLVCSSTPEILQMVINKLNNKFYSLPEIQNDGGVNCFLTAARKLGLESARLLMNLLAWRQTEVQEQCDFALNIDDKPVVEICCKLGANINAKNKDGRNLLNITEQKNNFGLKNAFFNPQPEQNQENKQDKEVIKINK